MTEHASLLVEEAESREVDITDNAVRYKREAAAALIKEVAASKEAADLAKVVTAVQQQLQQAQLALQ